VKQEVPEGLENKYKDKCDLDGGEFDSGIMRPGSGIYFSCIIPFSDYGESCKSSDDCKGTCVYIGGIPNFCTEIESNVYSCSKTVEGICSDEKKGACTPHYEVEGNEIYHYMGLCEY
jgi:hypothetical protein